MSRVPRNLIKHKVGLLNLAAELGNISRACKVCFFQWYAAISLFLDNIFTLPITAG